ncbi:MAG: hypothetical protein QOF66_7610 [Mycobacterium sp.]|jgi:hypothetical protein|nr:hypothetical protein [Mycobacterium sp.]
MAKIGYARVSTADQNPQLQLDALAAAGCLKIYTDHASGTKADRPHWNACLADLRSGDTLIMWRIDRLGRNLRDLIDIVTTLQARGRRGGRKPKMTPALIGNLLPERCRPMRFPCGVVPQDPPGEDSRAGASIGDGPASQF